MLTLILPLLSLAGRSYYSRYTSDNAGAMRCTVGNVLGSLEPLCQLATILLVVHLNHSPSQYHNQCQLSNPNFTVISSATQHNSSPMSRFTFKL
ncbi:hypothetical protein BYT27DRAFT_6643820 [Phlegmacium glaucopus]|nr:hypothetical protein BYT27DRAFT_6643820 [Phlegmacium glaucopus]